MFVLFNLSIFSFYTPPSSSPASPTFPIRSLEGVRPPLVSLQNLTYPIEAGRGPFPPSQPTLPSASRLSKVSQHREWSLKRQFMHSSGIGPLLKWQPFKAISIVYVKYYFCLQKLLSSNCLANEGFV